MIHRLPMPPRLPLLLCGALCLLPALSARAHDGDDDGWAGEANADLPQEPEAPAELGPEDVVLDEAEIHMVSADKAQGGVRIGAMTGWGSAVGRDNPWGFGLGVQGGYTLESGFHMGAKFLYFLGEVDGNVFDFGFEGGYAFSLGQVSIIPTLGTGFIVITLGERSSPEFYLAPGSNFLLDLPDFYLGVDARAQIVFSQEPFVALIGLALLGLKY